MPLPTPPPADRDVSRARVLALVDQLVPKPGLDLAAVDWSVADHAVAEGWDNVQWPVGCLGGVPLVLRLARRELAAGLLEREQVALRHLVGLGRRAPMGVPRLFASTPGALLLGWVPGSSAAELPPEPLVRVGGEVAAMLSWLHGQPAPQLDPSPFRGVDLRARAQVFATDLERAPLDAHVRDHSMELWQQGLQAAPWDLAGVLMHGDPHPGNVVAGGGGEEYWLIDWGDVTCGDPASDLGALLLFDPAATVLQRYRDSGAGAQLDECRWAALRDRSWAWAARMALALLGAYPARHPLGRCALALLEHP